MKHVYIDNPWLKVLSLVLAVITWFYIADTLDSKRTDEKGNLVLSKYSDIVIKDILIKPNIIGQPPKGYFLDKDSILVQPKSCLVGLSRDICNYIESVKTKPIDISNRTRSFSVNVGLDDVMNKKIYSNRMFNVLISIKKEDNQNE